MPATITDSEWDLASGEETDREADSINLLSMESGLAIIGFAGLSKLLLVMTMAALGVRVTSTSGDTAEGELRGFKDDSISVEVDGDVVEYAYDSVLSVERLEKDEEATPPTMEVTLLSGSTVRVVDMNLKEETFRLEPRRQDAISMPLKKVKSARFRLGSPATDPQWLGLMETDGRRDVIAIRREGDQIDPASVIINSIADGKVGFELSGKSGDASMTRLEGVIFGGKRTVQESAVVQVQDVYGSKWAVRSIEPSKGEELLMVLGDSLRHKISFDHIDSIRWSSGLLMLASQEPAKKSYAPYLKTNVSADTMAKWFGPEVEKQSDLVLVGGASIEYRIEGDYTTLAGSVTRSQRVSKAGGVTVVIELDDKEVWKESISGGDARGFQINTGRAKRVRFIVDSGDDGDVGDTVRISRPRLLK